MESLNPELDKALRNVAEGRAKLERQLEIAAQAAEREAAALATERLDGLRLALEADCDRLERLLTCR